MQIKQTLIMYVLVLFYTCLIFISQNCIYVILFILTLISFIFLL